MRLSVRTASTTTLIHRLSSTVHTVFCVRVDVWSWETILPQISWSGWWIIWKCLWQTCADMVTWKYIKLQNLLQWQKKPVSQFLQWKSRKVSAHTLLHGSNQFIYFIQPHMLHIHDWIHTPAFLPDELNLYFVHPSWGIILLPGSLIWVQNMLLLLNAFFFQTPDRQ